jgi:hypothetical protein
VQVYWFEKITSPARVPESIRRIPFRMENLFETLQHFDASIIKSAFFIKALFIQRSANAVAGGARFTGSL